MPNDSTCDQSKLDWELDEEYQFSKLVLAISSTGRLWTCCANGSWYLNTTGDAKNTDKLFVKKFQSWKLANNTSVVHPLPFCRSGLSLMPHPTHIRPMTNLDTHNIQERQTIIQQLRSLAVPNEIVLYNNVHMKNGKRLRGMYSNYVYGMDDVQMYFVHYVCMYLWDTWVVEDQLNSLLFCMSSIFLFFYVFKIFLI